MQIQQNISLRQYNTVGIDVQSKYFASFTGVEELTHLLAFAYTQNVHPLVLGGGSNVLFTRNFAGIVMKNDIPGIELIKEDAHHVYVKAGAGENWHRFVEYCITRNWAGLENLSLIPGSVGAGPMQNIGAYGVELKNVFEELDAYDTTDKKVHTFSANDCEFGYRDSIFKKRYRNRFVILGVTFRLNKIPAYNTSYGAIDQELHRMGVKELSIRAISQAVINIRNSKLPDPAKTGNAGSFFKNPSVSKQTFTELKNGYPLLPGYDNHDGTVKLSAGWLIENTAPPGMQTWKGFRRGDAGCYEKQALVLVNYGNATGQEMFQLSEEILQSVKSKFGVELEREVNIF